MAVAGQRESEDIQIDTQQGMFEESEDEFFSSLDHITERMSTDKKQEYLKIKKEVILFKKRLEEEIKKKSKEVLRNMLLSVKKGDFIGERSILLMALTHRFGGIPLNYMEMLAEASENSFLEFADRIIEAKSLEEIFDLHTGV